MGKKMPGEFAALEAEALIQKWGITSLPIDPFKIAGDHEITVMAKPSDTPGVSGFLVRDGERYGIMYATHIKSAGFINFTVSHELGHYFLPGHPQKLFPSGSGVHRSRSGFICDDECEVEADHFAAALLMPEPLFVEAINSAGNGFPAVEKLATICGTSISATAIRYAKFADDPVAVIVSSGRRIDYCFMSSPLKELRGITWIRKGDSLPPRCETLSFNADPENVRSARRVEGWTRLDLWFDGAPAVEIREDVVGLGSYGKTLTVLFTDEPLDLDDGEDDDD